jgi:hypothetical protein
MTTSIDAGKAIENIQPECLLKNAMEKRLLKLINST